MSRIKLLTLVVPTLLSTVSVAQPPPQPQVGTPYVYKSVGATSLHLWVVPPADAYSGLHPAIVFFHGGGWANGTVSQFNFQSTELAARGLVAIDVEYRLISKQAGPESPKVCVEDAKSAMRWVRAHANEFHIDPAKIIASGGSAGGYLAVATASLPDWNDPGDDLGVSPKPDALVLFFPVIIVDHGYSTNPFDGDPAGHSPENFVTAKTPPTLIEAGESDKLVKPETLREYKAVCDQAGARTEINFYPGQGHGFANTAPYNAITLNDAIRFLKTLEYLPAGTKEVRVPDVVQKDVVQKDKAEE